MKTYNCIILMRNGETVNIEQNAIDKQDAKRIIMLDSRVKNLLSIKLKD